MLFSFKTSILSNNDNAAISRRQDGLIERIPYKLFKLPDARNPAFYLLYLLIPLT